MDKQGRNLFMLLFVVVASVSYSQTGRKTTPPADDIRLTWSESPRTTQTIGWRTDSTITVGKVQYAAPGQSFRTVSSSGPEALLTNVGRIHLFTVTLRSLEPGTRYTYRVGDGSEWSATYTFATEQAVSKAFDFLVFGDSHEKQPSYAVWNQTATQAFKDNPQAKFFVSLGDLIYSGKDYVQWQAWFTACKDIVARIPVFPVIGDHEPRGTTSKELWQRPEYFVKLFKGPQNGPENFKGEVYSFDYGTAHIVVLNSSFTYELADSAARQNMIEAETAWLDADLSSTKQPWKVVIYHDATYNLSADRSGVYTKKYFGPIIDKHHVDAVFNGHDHAMARSYFINNEQFVQTAAQGTVYFISGRTGNNVKETLGRRIWHPFFHDPQSQTCYLVVSVDHTELRVKTRLQDGTIVDDFRINRKDPSLSTPVVPFGAYQTTRFAPFGSLLQSGRPPQQSKSGEWFVDINALVSYLAGSFNPVNNILSYDDNGIKLQLTGGMFSDSSKTMVSLSGLRAVGFYCNYHPAMNLITVERWRD
jgi:acid phosphatase type 7